MALIEIDDLQMYFLRSAIQWRIQNLELALNKEKYSNRGKQKC